MTVPRRSTLAPAVRFVAFVAEREAIRVRRENGDPPPWTDDEILRTYRFTNIRRRDDRVSKWLQANVYASPIFREPSLVALQFAALCRWVNWPPTIAALSEEGLWPAETLPWPTQLDLHKIGRWIDQRTKLHKTWTGAYMIRADPTSGTGKGRFVAEQVVGRALQRAWPEMQFMLLTGMRRPVWRVLLDCLHWGPFMAGQVVDDLTWTPLLPNPRDDFTWAPQGPGSLRGLNRILGVPLSTQHEELEWCDNLQILWGAAVDRLGVRLTLMDIQNCLCEFDKYERVRLGEGRPRALYHPETSY